MVDLDRKLAAVALAHHGIITLADVEAAGGNHNYVQARIDAGRWTVVHRGVYRLAGVAETYEAQVFAAICAAGPGAVASHFCAARLHGIGFARAIPELSIARGRFHRPKAITVHTSTDLESSSIVHIAGCIPTTDPNRTLLDLARRLRPNSLRHAVNDARRARLVDWQSLLATLVSHARRGRPGIRRFREVVARGVAENDLTETDSEQVAVALMREAGLPDPTLQHEVRAADGRVVARMDLAYVDLRINYEIDGSIHDDPDVAAKDDERDHELRTRYGWIVRRIPYRIPIDEPRRFLAIVRETLRLRNDSNAEAV